MMRKGKMNIEPEIKEALKSFGFTEYYITIYLRLLVDGELDARSLSDRTKVPYSRIYEVLNEMIKKAALISKIDGRPSTFIATPPIEMFNNLKIRQEAEFIKNMNISKRYLNSLYEPSGSTKEIKAVIVQGTKSCLIHIKNIIKNTVLSLRMILTDVKDLYSMKEELQFLKIKKTKIDIIICESEKKDPFINEIKTYCSIKFHKGPFPIIIISDDSVTFQIETGKFNIAYPNQVEYLGLSINNSFSAKILESFFNKMWKTNEI